MNNVRSIVSLIVVLCVLSNARAQAPLVRISNSGALESKAFEVNFKEPVLNPPTGVAEAKLEEIGADYPRVRNYFEHLKVKYGAFKLIKQIPNDIWGDTIKPRAFDGKLVRVPDMSQLYLVLFERFVPIGEIIDEMNRIPEVAYADPPVQGTNFVDPPNDPEFNNQWNLAKIEALKAWDITKGSSSVTVAAIELATITESGVPNKNHPDFITSTGQSKFDPNKGEQASGSGPHATMVTGIMGSATNNGVGIASLGWDLKLSYYTWTTVESYTPTLASIIRRAVDEGNRVINCSWGTDTLVQFGTQCLAYVSRHYGSVQLAVNYALQMGVVVVAAAGNSFASRIYRAPCDDYQDELFPFIPYPAGYNGVIAVSATGSNDIWAEGTFYNNGAFINASAPGISVLGLDGSGGYQTNSGTSFSSPHAATLAGLIVSLKPDLTPQQVKDIITSSSDKVDASSHPYNSNGWNRYLGFGRINAYKAVTLVPGSKVDSLAGLNHSVSVSATEGNNQRKMYRESSGKLHEVLESGGQIFYRNSTDEGATWQSMQRISGNTILNYSPSITGGYYYYATFLYVVWQKKNSISTTSTTWDVVYNYSNDNGATWQSAPIVLASNLSCPSPGPMPTIMASTPSNGFEALIVYRTSSDLKSAWTAVTNPGGSWTTITVNGTNTQSRNPSLAYQSNNYGHFKLAWNEDNKIYWSSFYGGNWSSSPTWVSSGAYMVSDQGYPSYSVVGNFDHHIVWDGNYSGRRAVVHNKNVSSFYNVISSSSYDYYRPSVSSNATYEATVAWYDNTNRVLNTSINAGYPINSGSVLSSSGSYPSLSINNPPGGTAKAIWRGGSISPYPIQVGNPTFQKASRQIQWKQLRIIAYQNREKGAELTITIGRLNAKGYDGKEYYASLTGLAENDSILRVGPSEYLRSESFVLPRGVESAEIECSISSKRLSHFADQMEINLDLVSSESGKVFAPIGNSQLSGPSTSSSEVFKIMSRAFLDTLASGEHFMRVMFSGIKNLDSADNVSCINVYEEIPLRGVAIDIGRRREIESVSSFSFDLLQNYPNPFNPNTQIFFTIPSNGNVKLRVFDVLGREVATSLDEYKIAGAFSVDFNGDALPSGVYFYRLEQNGRATVKKMLLTK